MLREKSERENWTLGIISNMQKNTHSMNVGHKYAKICPVMV